jgi:hypothetical protein
VKGRCEETCAIFVLLASQKSDASFSYNFFAKPFATIGITQRRPPWQQLNEKSHESEPVISPTWVSPYGTLITNLDDVGCQGAG